MYSSLPDQIASFIACFFIVYTFSVTGISIVVERNQDVKCFFVLYPHKNQGPFRKKAQYTICVKVC